MKKKLLRLALWTLAALATSVALFYAWTDWAGARRWKAVEASLRAKGEPLTVAEIQPPPLADELNFAAAPIFAEIARRPDSASQWRLSAIKGFVGGYKAGSSPLANAARSVEPGFAGTAAAAARRILAETEKWCPLLDEVRAAAKRPGTAWTLDYRDGFHVKVGYIQVLMKLAQAFFGEAKAHLELGHAAAALENFRLILDLSERAATPPLVINHLVRVSIVGLDCTLLAAGLERHQWSAAQLEAMQHALEGVSLTRSLAQALRGERVIFNRTLIEMSAGDFHAVETMDAAEKDQDAWASFLWKIRPRGWAHEDRSAYSERLQEWIERLNTASGRTFTELSVPPASSLSAMRLPMANMVLRGIAPALNQTIYVQARLDAAVVACAVERYRLATGSLPARLDTLVPAYLAAVPRDLAGEGALRYRVLAPGRAVIYSVAWNGRDDGGDGVDPKRPQRKESIGAPDWVWPVE